MPVPVLFVARKGKKGGKGEIWWQNRMSDVRVFVCELR